MLRKGTFDQLGGLGRKWQRMRNRCHVLSESAVSVVDGTRLGTVQAPQRWPDCSITLARSAPLPTRCLSLAAV